MKKKMKSKRLKIILSLFSDDMILYLEVTKKCTNY